MYQATIYFPDGKKQIFKETAAVTFEYYPDCQQITARNKTDNSVIADFVGFPYKLEKIKK